MARATGLVDRWGRPIGRSALRGEEAAPSVTGVRQVLGGHPDIGLTPQRLARILREAEEGDPTRYLELAEAMEEKDLHYASVLGTRKRQVAQLKVTVTPAGDSAEELRHAELVEDWLERDELQDELIDVLDAVGKGYSLTEIVWDTSEGQWLPERLEWRDPRWFEFDRDDGRTPLLRDLAGPRPLTPFKYVYHCSKAKSGLPVRGGLARLAAWMYLFKNYGVKDWVAFMEVYGMPLRVGKFHAGATKEEKEILLRAVRNIGTDVGAIIPEGMTIDFVDAVGKGSSSTDLYKLFSEWADAQISKGVLGQNLTTEVKGGSFAAAQVHNEVRGDIEAADAKQVSAALNRDLVRPIVDLNFGPQQAYPRLAVGREEEQDLKMMLAGVKTLVPMGARISRKKIQAAFQLPEAEDDKDLLTAAQAAAIADPDADGDGGGTPPGLARRRRSETEARAAREEEEAGEPESEVALDPAAAAALPLARAPVEALVERLRARILAARSYDEAQAAILELAGEAADPRLVELLREALALAQLQGADEVGGPEDGEVGGPADDET